MTSPALTGAQKSFLRSLGQTMDCQISIGREGITRAVLAELDKLFERHELVKVKLVAEREERVALCTEIVEQTGAIEAGAVGKTAIFFRQNPSKKARVVHLPEAKQKAAE